MDGHPRHGLATPSTVLSIRDTEQPSAEADNSRHTVTLEKYNPCRSANNFHTALDLYWRATAFEYRSG